MVCRLRIAYHAPIRLALATVSTWIAAAAILRAFDFHHLRLGPAFDDAPAKAAPDSGSGDIGRFAESSAIPRLDLVRSGVPWQ
ncbi:MAG: hypothetical protein ABIS17_00965 [Casimicrobiaceae bacterium]